MNFYILFAEDNIEDFVRPGPEADSLEKACRKSEFQFLDRHPLECSLSEFGGVEFPDFIIHGGCVPLISESMRQILDRNGVDNLFYKLVYLADSALGMREPYWLALPPRIDCLDVKRSVVEGVNEYGSLGRHAQKVTHIVIDPEKIGNYQIFRLPPIYENQEIIIGENLRSVLAKAALVNAHFQKL